MTPLCLLLVLGATLVYSQILPNRCNSAKVTCVGEGGNCNAQFDDECFTSYATLWSTCARCADDSLICHGGRCMKRTQGRNEICDYDYDGSRHLFCQAKLSCSGGICRSDAENPPDSFLARGETCQTPSDCWSGTCDPFVNKCVETSVDQTSGEIKCNYWSQCQWEEYCSPTDSTVSPTIASTCKPVPGGFGSRGGSLCKPPTTGPVHRYPTGQCGWTQFCVNHQQDENDWGHTEYTATTCQQPYSLPEGSMCPLDIGSGILEIGTAGPNAYPISFCSSGPCVSSGPDGLYRCTSADYTYAGTGCRADAECGRGLMCSCPSTGGARARCSPSTSGTLNIQQWEQGRNEWFSKLKPWFSCLENNQCTLNDDQKGSCGEKHCKGTQKEDPTHCQTDLYNPQINVPRYKGYADTIGAGGHVVPSVFVILLLSALLALFH